MAQKRIAFKDFIKLQRGFDLPRQNMSDGPYPVVGSTSIIGYHNEYKVSAPGVVTGRSGSLGQVQFISSDYWPHNTALWVKDFKGNFPQYVYYLLQTLDLKRFNSGVGVPTLNRNDLDALEIEIHDEATQRKIAAILSAYDDLIENNTRRIKILEKMAQMLYREWFVNFRFPGHEKVKMVNSRLGKVPEGWELRKFSDAVQINPAISVDRDAEKPFVEMAGLTTDSMIIECNATRTGSSGSKFQNRDVLFPRITPSVENGKGGFVQFLPNNAVALGSTEFIVFRSLELCPEYVYCLSKESNFREHAAKSMVGASGRQRVQEKCFDQYLLAKPPTEFLNRFSEIVSPMFTLVQHLAIKNTTLRRTRDLLLPKLISGE